MNVSNLYQHASELSVLSNLNNESPCMNIDGKRRLTKPRKQSFSSQSSRTFGNII